MISLKKLAASKIGAAFLRRRARRRIGFSRGRLSRSDKETQKLRPVSGGSPLTGRVFFISAGNRPFLLPLLLDKYRLWLAATRALPGIRQLFKGLFAIINVSADRADPLRICSFPGGRLLLLARQKILECLTGRILHMLLIIAVEQRLAVAIPGVCHLSGIDRVGGKLFGLHDAAAQVGGSIQ